MARIIFILLSIVLMNSCTIKSQGRYGRATSTPLIMENDETSNPSLIPGMMVFTPPSLKCDCKCEEDKSCECCDSGFLMEFPVFIGTNGLERFRKYYPKINIPKAVTRRRYPKFNMDKQQNKETTTDKKKEC